MKKFCVAVVIVVLFSASFFTVRAQTSDVFLSGQLTIMLQRLVTLLLQRIDDLQRQVATQQEEIDRLNTLLEEGSYDNSGDVGDNGGEEEPPPPPPPPSPPKPAFYANIDSNKSSILNDGKDFATLTIQTMLDNGVLLKNKKVLINNTDYTSNSQGIIVYKTRTVCSKTPPESISVNVSADGKTTKKIIPVLPYGSCSY